MSANILRLKTPLTVSITATSAQSSAISSTSVSGFSVIRLVSTVDIHVLEGSNPTATTSHSLIVANQPEYFEIANGNKLAAIRASEDGTLYITVMS